MLAAIGILRRIRYVPASLAAGPQIASRAFSTTETPNPPAEASKSEDPAPPEGDGEPPKRRHSRRVSRKVRGSYASIYGDEIENSMPELPFTGFLYNPRDLVIPRDQEPDLGPFARVIENPDVLKEFMPLAEENRRAIEELPYPGAKPILNWTTRFILQAGDDQYHPLNSKVECTFRMTDLQAEYDLSKEAADFIAAVCGPRYNKGTGVLRLVSTKYRDREDNRRDIMRIISELIDAGHAEAERLKMEGSSADGAEAKTG